MNLKFEYTRNLATVYCSEVQQVVLRTVPGKHVSFHFGGNISRTFRIWWALPSLSNHETTGV